MGEGWSFSYSDRLCDGNTFHNGNGQLTPDANKLWFTDDGIQHTFTYSSGTYTTPATLFGTLSYGVYTGYTWTDTKGNTVRFDIYGRLESKKDRYGDGIEVTYIPGTNRIDKVNRALNSVSQSYYLEFEYDGPHIKSITDPAGRTWQYDYDAKGRLTRVRQPSDADTPASIVRYDYYDDDNNANTPDGPALAGLLKSVTDPNGGVTKYEYYANRRGFKVTDSAGNEHSLSYNLYRNRTAFTDELGNTSYTTYDDKGNLTEEISPDGVKISYQWDTTRGLRTATTDAYGQTDKYAYDARSNLTAVLNRENGSTVYAYTDDYSNLDWTAEVGRRPDNVPFRFFNDFSYSTYNNTSGSYEPTDYYNGNAYSLELTGNNAVAVQINYTIKPNTV